jgi:plasmid stability protein
MVPSPQVSKLLQVRQVPDDVHRTLKVRAAQAGTSLSEYVRAELELIASRPTPEELRTRLEARTPVEVRETAAELIRRHRDA